MVCYLGLLHAIASLILTVAGAFLKSDVQFVDPVRPLAEAALVSFVWGFFGVLTVVPILWVLTLKGSRHARAILVGVLLIRLIMVAVLMHLVDLADGDYFALGIVGLIVVDVIAVVMLFGGHRTSTYFHQLNERPVRPRGDYGIDTLYVPVISIGGGIALLVFSAFLRLGGGMAVVTLIGVILCIHGVWFVYASLRGKFLIWNDILAELPPPGRILDLGCGRGMAILLALDRWPHATGVGVDRWRRRDQSGNSMDAFIENANEAGVANRLSAELADLFELPFADASFDLVVSSLAVHHIQGGDHRRDVMSEIMRVVRPGGQIRIVDIRHAKQYADDLRALGAVDVVVGRCGLRGWFGSPFLASEVVSAQVRS